MSHRFFGVAASYAILLALAHPAAADKLAFQSTLSPQNEVPPIQSSGRGAAELTFDTASRELSWTVTFQGLSGPVRAAHFHGAATASQNAPITLPIASRDSVSPIKGSKVLTPEQVEALTSGRWYINIHTAAHPPGEIRGQVVRR